jgi:hypothetical protein
MKTHLALVAFAAAFVSSASVTTPASAHSVTACLEDVVSFCGADAGCKQIGFAACHQHRHSNGSGGTVPPAPDPQNTFSNDPGRQLNESGTAFKAQ